MLKKKPGINAKAVLKKDGSIVVTLSGGHIERQDGELSLMESMIYADGQGVLHATELMMHISPKSYLYEGLLSVMKGTKKSVTFRTKLPRIKTPNK